MAGRKVFTSGEILTAADVNSFLMDQSVMVFADDAARSSAIPSPSEGMVTFREDQDVVEVFDGSAFKTVGGLVAVKSALKTDTFSASVGAGGNVAVTDLSITHEVSDPANRLIIRVNAGALASGNGQARLGLGLYDGSAFLNNGDASGSRTPVATSGFIADTSGGGNVGNRMPHSTEVVFSPGAGSKTYTVRLINTDISTRTLYLNRSEDNGNFAGEGLASTSFTLMEVAV